MRNEVCNHCKYKRAFCWFFHCDEYFKAQYKRTERRFYKNYLEDFDAEDRYTTSLIFGWAIFIFIMVLLIMSGIKVIGEWWS